MFKFKFNAKNSALENISKDNLALYLRLREELAAYSIKEQNMIYSMSVVIGKKLDMYKDFGIVLSMLSSLLVIVKFDICIWVMVFGAILLAADFLQKKIAYYAMVILIIGELRNERKKMHKYLSNNKFNKYLLML